MFTLVDKKIDGRAVAAAQASKLAKKIALLKVKGVVPKLVIIQIGDVKESNSYIRNKKVFADKVGAIVVHETYPKSVAEGLLLKDIQKYNSDKSVHGIIVQLPIPKKLNKNNIIEVIDPKKDVDGLTSFNTKLLVDGVPGILPPTTKGILTLFDQYGISVKGKKVVIVGRSGLVGKPTALALLNLDATVTVCHIHTKNLSEETKKADILIVAAGHPHLLTNKFVSKGQVVIDVGITVLSEKDRKVSGDVDYAAVSKVVAAVTPVPGGVGPMTIVSLFENLITCCISLS